MEIAREHTLNAPEPGATLCPVTKFLSTTEAAKKLGISVQRLHILIQDHRIPVTLIGKRYALREEDVDAFERSRPRKVKTDDTGEDRTE